MSGASLKTNGGNSMKYTRIIIVFLISFFLSTAYAVHYGGRVHPSASDNAEVKACFGKGYAAWGPGAQKRWLEFCREKYGHRQ